MDDAISSSATPSMPPRDEACKLAFLGALQAGRECGWRTAVMKQTDAVFPSRSLRRGWRALKAQVAARIQASSPLEIRVVGYSWGGWTALQVASRIAREPARLHPDLTLDGVRLRVGVLDPVGTLRARIRFPQGADVKIVNLYQRNGCWKRCAGNPMWYAGSPVAGARNIDVTLEGRDQPECNGVPVTKAPDHMQLGYFSWEAYDDLVASLLAGVDVAEQFDRRNVVDARAPHEMG